MITGGLLIRGQHDFLDPILVGVYHLHGAVLGMPTPLNPAGGRLQPLGVESFWAWLEWSNPARHGSLFHQTNGRREFQRSFPGSEVIGGG